MFTISFFFRRQVGLQEEVRMSAGERKMQHLKSGNTARDLQKASGDDVWGDEAPFQRELVLSAVGTKRRLLQSCVPDTSTSPPHPEISPASGTTRHPSRRRCCYCRRRFQQSCQGPKDEAFVAALRLGAGVLGGGGGVRGLEGY